MRFKNEEGQSIIIVALAMSIFLIGAVGLGFDGSQLYEQRTLAQNTADSAAIAGILSIFNGTTGAAGTGFATSGTLTCSATDARTPCAYAIKNGFGTSNDTVTIDFPSSVSGVALSSDFSPSAIRINVQRNVNTTLMRLLGATVTTVKATATAAIVAVTSPVPIIVMHPTHVTSFSLQGTPIVKICGGPSRSIQVNPGNATAAATGGNASVDLSKAGPLDTGGTCTTGTGADFGVWGGPTSTTAVSVNYGTKPGRYVQPASIIPDPLRNVAAPPIPTNTGTMGTHPALADGISGCPSPNPGKPCQLYHPGLYPTGITANNSSAVFAPGIYYIQSGGIDCHNNCDIYMATGITDSGANTTGTGWDGTSSGGGVLFYGTGAGQFHITANGSATLIGSPAGSSYKGILFFEDHTAASNTSDNSPNNPHILGGGGQMTLIGTIYLTNTRATMLTTPTKFQELDLKGGSGSGTLVQGEIIVDSLQLGGNGSITMNLNSSATLIIPQVALVN
jgi:hypothetical protein